jgi:hypothetical protein
MAHDAYRITSAPSRPRRGGVVRGLLAVAALLITAADALITALIGIPPIGWMWRQVAAVITSTYRRAAARPGPIPGSEPVLITTVRVVQIPPPDEETTNG